MLIIEGIVLLVIDEEDRLIWTVEDFLCWEWCNSSSRSRDFRYRGWSYGSGGWSGFNCSKCTSDSGISFVTGSYIIGVLIFIVVVLSLWVIVVINIVGVVVSGRVVIVGVPDVEDKINNEMLLAVSFCRFGTRVVLTSTAVSIPKTFVVNIWDLVVGVVVVVMVVVA